ncbi:MAG: amidohydrolase family protein, partial [Clostridia bacterium]|nr:amidohydrolase family protein [Clostridia bacterium]
VFETGADYFENLLTAGVCGFVTSANPQFTGSLDPTSMQRPVSALLAHKKPLLVLNSVKEAHFAKIIKLAQAYPELPIVMCGTSWGTNRLFFEAMDRCDNLHFEITDNHTNNILEIAKENYGCERVLYNANWPIKSMGAHKAFIEYAKISDADKDLIAHGNACRLFGISSDSLELYDDSACKLDEIALEADIGKPISVPVIDCHTHIVGKGDAINAAIMTEATADGVIEKMDRLGIDAIMTAPWIGIFHSGTEGNEETLEAAKKYPGRILGYSCCNVNYEDERAEVLGYHENNPDIFVGIKPYPPQFKFDLEGELCREWFEYANEHHLPALIHTACDDYAQKAGRLSERYPNITFILAHTGAGFDVARENSEIAKAHDNVVLDITYTSTYRGMVEFLVDAVGADKVLYGSDTAMRDMTPQLGWVCYADISAEDKKKVLAGNIKRILAKRK